MTPTSERMLELQAAMNAYGEASIVLYKDIHVLAKSIINGFEKYLGEGAQIRGVPPVGDWNPNKDYRGEMFDNFDKRTLCFDTVTFGLALRFPHSTDEGELWIRVPISITPERGEFSIKIRLNP
jgi:hypothetical protein